MDELINKQTVISGQINIAIINFKKTSKNCWTICYITSKLEALNDYWKAFDENHVAISSTYIEMQDEDKVDSEISNYIDNDTYAKMEDIVFEHRGIMRQHLVEMGQAQPQNTAPTSANAGDITAPASASIDVRLPKIQIPTFSGDYNVWRSFYDLFVFSVHNNNKLCRVQKLHYLKTSLSDEASQLIQHLQLCNENYEPAWELLVQRYENKKVLVHSQLKTLTVTAEYDVRIGIWR